MCPFDTFPRSESKSETTQREFVAGLLLRSVIRICLGRQEGLEQTHSIRVKISPPKMGKVPKIRPKIANDPMRVNYFPVFPSMITSPEVTNTGPGVNRGSGGGARGCGFEERVGVHTRTGGIHFLKPSSVCNSATTKVTV